MKSDLFAYARDIVTSTTTDSMLYQLAAGYLTAVGTRDRSAPASENNMPADTPDLTPELDAAIDRIMTYAGATFRWLLSGEPYQRFAAALRMELVAAARDRDLARDQLKVANAILAEVIDTRDRLAAEVAECRRALGLNDGDKLISGNDGGYLSETRTGQRQRVTIGEKVVANLAAEVADAKRELIETKRQLEVACSRDSQRLTAAETEVERLKGEADLKDGYATNCETVIAELRSDVERLKACLPEVNNRTAEATGQLLSPVSRHMGDGPHGSSHGCVEVNQAFSIVNGLVAEADRLRAALAEAEKRALLWAASTVGNHAVAVRRVPLSADADRLLKYIHDEILAGPNANTKASGPTQPAPESEVRT